MKSKLGATRSQSRTSKIKTKGAMKSQCRILRKENPEDFFRPSFVFF